jgi:hypothetical protein
MEPGYLLPSWTSPAGRRKAARIYEAARSVFEKRNADFALRQIMRLANRRWDRNGNAE